VVVDLVGGGRRQVGIADGDGMDVVRPRALRRVTVNRPLPRPVNEVGPGKPFASRPE
jgi:hypothetical protein